MVCVPAVVPVGMMTVTSNVPWAEIVAVPSGVAPLHALVASRLTTQAEGQGGGQAQIWRGELTVGLNGDARTHDWLGGGARPRETRELGALECHSRGVRAGEGSAVPVAGVMT